MYVCMYVCMFLFICLYMKLHITAESGPVLLVIICYSHICVCMYGITYGYSKGRMD